MMISPAQCRAGRALIGMHQKELATRSGVSLRTVAGFELGTTTPIPATRDAIKRALEAAGITFTERGVELTDKDAGA